MRSLFGELHERIAGKVLRLSSWGTTTVWFVLLPV